MKDVFLSILIVVLGAALVALIILVGAMLSAA
jgi:hypothetical protein